MTARNIVAGSLAVVGVTALGLAGLVGVTWALAAVLGDTVAAAILAGAAPLLATFGLGVWNDYRESQELVAAENRRLRGEAYRSFLRFLFDLIARLEDDEQSNELDLAPERYGSFLQGIMVWGSDELIELWNEFRKLDLPDLDPDRRYAWLARLLEQVREDLRGTDSGLSASELYDLYSTEPEAGHAEDNPGVRR